MNYTHLTFHETQWECLGENLALAVLKMNQKYGNIAKINVSLGKSIYFYPPLTMKNSNN